MSAVRLRIAAAVAALACALPVPALASADALLGRWRTQERGGVVEIVRCGKSVCGRVVDAAPLRANPDQRDVRNPDKALRNRPLKGLVILQGFSGGPEKWSGGSLYDPNSGDGSNDGYLTLAGRDTLKVKGCIASFLCRTQTWTRLR